MVIPELVPIAEKDGKVIGFGITLPDLNVIFQKNRSGRMFPMILKLLWALKTRKIRRARILLLGVMPEYRGKGVDAMLYHWIWTKSGEREIYWGEAGWILEDNPAMNAGLETRSAAGARSGGSSRHPRAHRDRRARRCSWGRRSIRARGRAVCR